MKHLSGREIGPKGLATAGSLCPGGEPPILSAPKKWRRPQQRYIRRQRAKPDDWRDHYIYDQNGRDSWPEFRPDSGERWQQHLVLRYPNGQQLREYSFHPGHILLDKHFGCQWRWHLPRRGQRVYPSCDGSASLRCAALSYTLSQNLF